jgi:hypothetical protein
VRQRETYETSMSHMRQRETYGTLMSHMRQRETFTHLNGLSHVWSYYPCFIIEKNSTATMIGDSYPDTRSSTFNVELNVCDARNRATVVNVLDDPGLGYFGENSGCSRSCMMAGFFFFLPLSQQ